MFNKFAQSDIKALESILPGRVFKGDEINEDYYHDELGTAYGIPEVLVKVLTTEEVSHIMQYANEHLIPVVVRGSGTGLVGGSVATNGFFILIPPPTRTTLLPYATLFRSV